jgi:hypothetical protein
VAYGARLESVLGESPRGFESPILRQGNFNPVNPKIGRGCLFPGKTRITERNVNYLTIWLLSS